MGKLTALDWERAAFIVIDMQNDFVLPEGAMPVEGALEVLPVVSDILKKARKVHVPVIHIVRYYLPDGSNADLCRRAQISSGKELVAPGTWGAEIVSELKPESFINQQMDERLLMDGNFQKIGEKEWIIYKPRWGAFYQTCLENLLKNEGIDSLIFMGINFPNCPRTSIYEASERDFCLGILKDAMSRLYNKGIEELESIGVTVMDSKQAAEKLINLS